MNITRTFESEIKYERSPQIFERRRALFPTTERDEVDSDLGHISPLGFDSTSEHDDLHNIVTNVPNSFLSPCKSDTIGDYDIIGIVENNHLVQNTPTTKQYAASETMSPLYLSPYTNGRHPASFYPTKTIDTPPKFSPSYNLKTPHDSSNTNSKIPKLTRKSLLDVCFSENKSVKRKLSPSSPSETKPSKTDSKNSKVRTALFPEETVISTKSFYPKHIGSNKMDKIPHDNKIVKKIASFPAKKRVSSKKRFGQINAGVRHKIRKPKEKKFSKPRLLKAAITTMENSQLNGYLKTLETMMANQSTGLIEKENVSVPNVGKVDISRKRPHSPTPEPNSNKKFFKSSRQKAVVTLNKNMKFTVDNGKLSLMDNAKKRKVESQSEFDLSTSENESSPIAKSSNIDAILNTLTDCGVPHARTNAIKSQADILLSPTSQMCDMTSGLALNSPKKVKNLTSILCNMPNASNKIPANNDKLFPIFCGAAQILPEKKAEIKSVRGTAKKFKNCPDNQMLIDAGQKRFGVTQCLECKIVYHMGDPSDEMMHLNYHNAGSVFKFAGWKNERVTATFLDARIIQIIPGDSRYWWKKAKDLLEVVNRDLGYYDMEFSMESTQVFLYIKNKTIVGCITAVAKSEGHRLLTTGANDVDVCSEESFAIKCGVSRIWVSQNYRKQGVATALMNSIKTSFIFGSFLTNDDIAFSSPTEMGKKFASHYFSTPNFLVYCS